MDNTTSIIEQAARIVVLKYNNLFEQVITGAVQAALERYQTEQQATENAIHTAHELTVELATEMFPEELQNTISAITVSAAEQEIDRIQQRSIKDQCQSVNSFFEATNTLGIKL